MLSANLVPRNKSFVDAFQVCPNPGLEYQSAALQQVLLVLRDEILLYIPLINTECVSLYSLFKGAMYKLYSW